MNFQKIYEQLAKIGINQSPELNRYLREASLYHQRHQLISSIPREIWIYFNSVDPRNNAQIHCSAMLSEDLKNFDIYKLYENTVREIAVVPTSAVLKKTMIQKFNLAPAKPKKATIKKSAPKAKSNTRRTTKKSTTTHRKSTRRTKKGRATKKARSHKAKK